MGKKDKKSLVPQPLPPSHFGGFSQMGFITTGPTKEETDDYVKQEVIPSRYLGKNMMVRAARSGNLPEVYFDKVYSTLASAAQNNNKGDIYEDTLKVEARERAKAKERQQKLHKNADFKMASYPHKSTGPGSFVGCFQSEPFEHMPDSKPVQRGDIAVPIKTFKPRQIMTSYPHKGTYGVLGTTFGPFQSLYVMTEEMEAQRKKDEKRWEKKKAKMDKALAKNKKYQELLNRPVFRAMGTCKKTFDEKPVSGVSAAYDNYIAPEPKKKPKRKKKDKNAPKPLNLPTFRYSSPPKSGEAGYFNKFSNTRVEIDEAEEEKKRKKKERAERRKNKGKKKNKPMDHPVWKPVSGPKSSVVSSLLTRYY